ncbi:MAG TPA: NifU family protein [Polyangiaceae bacterium]
MVLKVCRDVLAPLVRADGGEIYVISATADDVHLHLTGACAGCPGASICRERMFEPAIARALPKAKIRLTTSLHPPATAEKV